MEQYIMSITASALIVTVASLILPEGNVKKYARLASSVVISLALASPLKAVFDISDAFDFYDMSSYEMTQKEAEKIYSDNLRKELGKHIEEALLPYGRAYVKISEDLKVESIEIYAEKAMDDESAEEIREQYMPERFEIIYGQY
ncbi:MAG: stage III sporulation protein AF [Clostridia bacterium]|nr:stage III sporulation protein AF [Clostridia bacterium]